MTVIIMVPFAGRKLLFVVMVRTIYGGISSDETGEKKVDFKYLHFVKSDSAKPIGRKR